MSGQGNISANSGHQLVAKVGASTCRRGVTLLLFAVLVAGPCLAAKARAGEETEPSPQKSPAKTFSATRLFELNIGPGLAIGDSGVMGALEISIRMGGIIHPLFELAAEGDFSLVFPAGEVWGFDEPPAVVWLVRFYASACYYPIASPGPFIEVGIGYGLIDLLALKAGAGYRFSLSPNHSLAIKLSWAGILIFSDPSNIRVSLGNELIGSIGIAWH